MPLMSLFKKHKSPQAATPSTMKPTSTSSGRTSASSDPNALLDELGRLSLDSTHASRHGGGRPSANGGFVGGFAPPRTDEMDWESTTPGTPSKPPRSSGRPHAAPPASFPEPQQYPGALPTPPKIPMSMPEPQLMSRTMVHALSGERLPPPPLPPKQDLRPPKQELRPPSTVPMARPHSDSGAFPPPSDFLQVPPTTPQRPTLAPAPNSAPAKPASSGPSRSSAGPPAHTPQRGRAQSSPPSPISVSASPGKNVPKVQCCAITKQDKRCTRTVAVSNPLALLNGEDIPQYCGQHLKNAFIDKKFRSRKDPSEEVYYDHWIPEYLKESTKSALRDKMQAAPSSADKPGYIYAYEIDDNANPDVVLIKVGRATKLTKRLGEWDYQCPTKQTHLLGFWPMSQEAEANGMMRNRLQVEAPGPYCHLVERLVHLELADLSLNAPYLDPDWPNVKADGGSGGKSTSARQPCPDCGTRHKEIFTFPRATGRYRGKEWEDIVRPVIEKWGGFVSGYV